MKNNAEVVIIGGGIIGCATAYYLAKEGVSVIVLEKSDHIGNGGSSRNGGGVRRKPSSRKDSKAQRNLTGTDGPCRCTGTGCADDRWKRSA